MHQEPPFVGSLSHASVGVQTVKESGRLWLYEIFSRRLGLLLSRGGGVNPKTGPPMQPVAGRCVPKLSSPYVVIHASTTSSLRIVNTPTYNESKRGVVYTTNHIIPLNNKLQTFS